MSIYWCIDCNAYRKYGSDKWWSCTQAKHTMHNGDEKFETEVMEKQQQININKKTGMEDGQMLGSLDALMMIKMAAADPKEPASRASMILDDNVEKYSKTIDDDGSVYFWIKRDDESYDAFAHDDEKLARFVIRKYGEIYGPPLSRPAAMQAIGYHTAKGDVPGNLIRHTGKRVIRVKDTVWIDLQDKENSIYKITPEHCGPTEPYSPKLGILFYRGAGSQMPMPHRREGDWLNWFAEMLRVPKDRRMLFRLHVCHMFCMWQETPFMMFSGPEGSGKTVATTMVKELVDPTGMNSATHSLPKDENKLAMMLSKEQTQLFDNISYVSPQVSDMLCQACTGGTYRYRELYTSNNVLTMPFRKMRILFTGISKTAIRAPDLASRILHYEVLPGKDPGVKEELETEYLENRPYILYAALETVSKAMREYNSKLEHYAKFKTKTRMAGFERFGRAIAYVLGDRDGSAITQYQEIMHDDMSMMVADEPMLRMTEKILEDEPSGRYYNLTNKFYARIREIAIEDDTIDEKGRDFPKNVVFLRRQMDKLKGAFLERGIEITIGKVHDKTAIKRQASHIIIQRLKAETGQMDADATTTTTTTTTTVPSDEHSDG